MPPARSVRDALLDAAYDAVVRGDWAGSRMQDVAAAAGVSRQTLYNTFGTKDLLGEAIALREAERFLAGIEALLEEHAGTPAEAVGAAVAWTLRTAADNPLLKAALTGDDLLPFLTTRGAAIHDASCAAVAAHLSQHWPDIPRADVDLLADTVVRLTTSHLLLPLAPTDVVAAGVAALVERFLLGRPAAPARRTTTKGAR